MSNQDVTGVESTGGTRVAVGDLRCRNLHCALGGIVSGQTESPNWEGTGRTHENLRKQEELIACEYDS